MIRRFLSGSLAVALFVAVVAGPAAAATPQWKIVPSPNVGDDENGFADVARIPGTKRFWAVGSWTDIFEWTPDRDIDRALERLRLDQDRRARTSATRTTSSAP